MSRRSDGDRPMEQPAGQPGARVRLWALFLALVALSLLAEAAIEKHPYFAIETIFGFAAWYGLLSCVALVLVAKALGAILKRPDDYYND